MDNILPIKSEMPDVSQLASSQTLTRILTHNFEASVLMIESAQAAMTSDRDCYRPQYPGNWTSFQSFNFLTLLADIKTFLSCHAETELSNHYDTNQLEFIYFTLCQPRAVIDQVGLFEDVAVWKFPGGSIGTKPYQPYYHGTSFVNLYSIFCNDLRTLSDTILMANGASHGRGVYTANDINIPLMYARSQRSVILVLEPLIQLQSGKNVKVFQDNEFAIRFAIVALEQMPGISRLKEVLTPFIIQDNRTRCPVVNNNYSARILKETAAFSRKNDSMPDIISFELLNPDNAGVWEIVLKISEDIVLGAELADAGIPGLTIQVHFPTHYPMIPPFIFLRKPILLPRTGHVIQGAICASFLAPGNTSSNDAGWAPSMIMENILPSLSSLISEDGKGRLDPLSMGQEYHLETAKRAFATAMNIHQWSA